MADVLHRTAGATFPYRKDYRQSVNEPDFPQADWIWDPDLSAVAGFDSIYWDIGGDTVSLANPATRNARDAEIAAAREQADKDAQKLRLDDIQGERVLRALVKVLIDEINILRQQHALADRTLAQARTAILNEIDGGI